MNALTTTFAGAALVVATLTTAASPVLAQTVSYKGTSKADLIIFRSSDSRYIIDGLAGNDLIVGGHREDILKGGAGRDTLDGYRGDGKLYGGAGSDYFRYSTYVEWTRWPSGDIIIADFKKGDKIDFYLNWSDGSGGVERVSGGNFKSLDNNKDGVINKADAGMSVKKVKVDGKTKDSLVIDLYIAFYEPEDAEDAGHGSLTIFGVTSLKAGDFVLDYERDGPYY